MYHFIVRQQVRRAFQQLNAGDYERVLQQFAPDIKFVFAGVHSLGGECRGVAIVREWFQCFFQYFPGLHFEIQAVLANGWPWDTIAATRFSIHARLSDGNVYDNVGMQFLRIRWGRIVEDYIYEDTQKIATVLEGIK